LPSNGEECHGLNSTMEAGSASRSITAEQGRRSSKATGVPLEQEAVWTKG
jgi:hypothetical protein